MLNFNLELRPELRRPPMMTQADIDAIRIDSRRYFAHRTQISTAMVFNTHWERYWVPRKRPNPWACAVVITICLYALWRLI